MSDLGTILKQVESIEAQMTAFHVKAAEEMKLSGTLNAETIKALDKLGAVSRSYAA